MLRSIKLTNFKCFRDLRIGLAPLSVLTGFNGTGKSTVVQSLLFIHQALADGLESAASKRIIPLNGADVSFGSIQDVVNLEHGRFEFEIVIEANQATIKWTCGGSSESRTDLAVPVQKMAWATLVGGGSNMNSTFLTEELLKVDACKRVLLSLQDLIFVPADRTGPEDVFPLDAAYRHRVFGARARFAVGRLFWGADEPLPLKGLLHPDSARAPTLARQVEAWMSDLFPGFTLEIQRLTSTNLVRVGLRTNETTGFLRPQHVGFGVSYVLPVIVALLSARHDDIVIIDSPESHLHPRAQSLLGRLCARAVSAGAQVIVETHSEHVVNGVRMAIHDGILMHEAALLSFFSEPGKEPDELKIDRDGKVERWPNGFFDESERALDQLLRPPA